MLTLTVLDALHSLLLGKTELDAPHLLKLETTCVNIVRVLVRFNSLIYFQKVACDAGLGWNAIGNFVIEGTGRIEALVQPLSNFYSLNGFNCVHFILKGPGRVTCF